MTSNLAILYTIELCQFFYTIIVTLSIVMKMCINGPLTEILAFNYPLLHWNQVNFKVFISGLLLLVCLKKVYNYFGIFWKPMEMDRSLTETAAAVLPSSQTDMTSSLFSKVGSMSSMSDISNWFKGNKWHNPYLRL